MAGPGPFSQSRDGIRVRVLVSPRASGEGVRGLQDDASGGAWLKVAVTAAPEGGKANSQMIKLLAKYWGIPKTTLRVVLGMADRRKTVLIEGADSEVMDRLTRWLNEAG